MRKSIFRVLNIFSENPAITQEHKAEKFKGIRSRQWIPESDQMAQLLALQARTPLFIFRKCQGFFPLPALYFVQRMTQGLRLLW